MDYPNCTSSTEGLQLRQRHDDLWPEATWCRSPSPAAGRPCHRLRPWHVGSLSSRFDTWQPAWRNTTLSLPPGRWQHLFADARFDAATIDLGDLFEVYPVARPERIAS